jgi:hypothetical protein
MAAGEYTATLIFEALPKQTISIPVTLSIGSAPSGLSATALSARRILLQWTANSSGELGFRIERSLNGVDGWVEVGTSAAGVVTFIDQIVAADTDYYYRVRAYATDGISDYSNTAHARSQLAVWLPLVKK